jgi:hypothetical protein
MIELQKTIDPRVNINSQTRRKYSVYEGGVDTSYLVHKPDNLSLSQLNFPCNPTSNLVFINRAPIIMMKFRLTFRGNSELGVPLIQSSGARTLNNINPGTARFDAPRCAPISQIINSINISLQNDRLSTNYNAYSRIFQRYESSQETEDMYKSVYPSMPDEHYNYSDYAMTSRSCLGAYAESQKNIGRGGYTGYTIIENGSGLNCTSIVEIESHEYLDLSPFNTSQFPVCGLYGIGTMQLSLSISGRSNNLLGGIAGGIFSHNPLSPSVFTQPVIVDLLDASLTFSYTTPPPSFKIPTINYYPYNEIITYPQTFGSLVAPGEYVNLTMNAVTLNSIPECVYVWADRSNASTDITTTDTYMFMDNIQISFDNRDSLLSTATAIEIYRIALKNGCNLSWSQWCQHIGSVVRLNFGEDVVLRQGSYVGTKGSYNLRIQSRFRNISNVAILPVLNVLVISEGVLTISNGSVSRVVGILENNIDISNLETVAPYLNKTVYGGKFNWQDVKDWLKKTKAISKTGQFLSDNFLPSGVAQNLANMAIQQVDKRGYGLQGGGIIGGGDMVKYKKKKSKKITRKEMMNLL